MGPISFEPTEADLIAAYRLNYRRSLTTWRSICTYLAGLAAFALGGSLIASGDGGRELVGATVAAALLWLTMLPLILALNYRLLDGRARRAFAQQKALHCRVEASWSQAGIMLESEKGNSRFEWTDFVCVAQDDQVVLLFQSDQMFNFLPKRAMSEAQACSIMAFGKAGGSAAMAQK